MNQRRIRMKAVERPAQMSGEDRHAALADYYLDSGYLPAEGDQSWRERAALGIVPSQEADAGNDVAMDFAPQKEAVDSDVPVGRRGGFLVALLLVAILVPVVAVLSFPDLLTAGFWRSPDGAARPVAAPSSQATLAPKTLPTLRASPPQAPAQPQPASEPKELSRLRPAPPSGLEKPAVPDRAAVSAETSRPPTIAVSHAHESRNDRGGARNGFYAKVPGPDGRLQERWFPEPPSASQPATADRIPAVSPDSGGFYAKVAGPDGTLQYRYFPPKPSR